MDLSEFEIRRIQKLVEKYCESRIPKVAQCQVKVEYKLRSNEVLLYEMRAYYRDPSQWYSSPIARFKKDPETQNWSLYCADRSQVWQLFERNPRARDVEVLFAEVAEDATGIFWG